MPPVIAGRFAIEREAGSGGMATVYRARDLTTGEVVALKCLASRGDHDVERFAQEAAILADLVHPAIVRYIAHGMAPDWTATVGTEQRPSRPYLAMEWLEGEDLAAQLARGALPPAQAIAALRRVADALALAHGRGVIHRDIKPENLFLPDRQLDRIKLLDFGIARVASLARNLTATGHLIGTPGYLAPEIIGGTRMVTARADVFALGCVMFHALTGKAPFDGENVAAILTKVLTVDPPRVDALVPRLPAALGDLVAAMLARLPEHRPADAGEVARALDAIAMPQDLEAAEYRRDISPSLTIGEQRIISVVAARLQDSAGHLSRLQGAIERDLEAAGGEAHTATDGAILVSLPRARKATDQARGAARLALLLRSAHPEANIALVTGPGQLSFDGPTGDVARDAAALLAVTPASTIRVDAMTAALLEGHFEIQQTAAGPSLRAPRAGFESRRRLLGNRPRSWDAGASLAAHQPSSRHAE